MRILVIGGTGFIGRFLIPELRRRGADVAVLSRRERGGSIADDVPRIVGDRNALGAAMPAVRAFAPDVVVDLVLSSGRQARSLTDAMRGVAQRVVAVSSVDVYRACGVLHGSEPGPLEPLPLTEESPLRTVMQTYPPAQIEALQRIFGWVDDEYDKIPVERAVLGDPSLPGTVLRLPMIYGPGDPLHRLWGLVKRMDDRRPALLMERRMAAWRGPRGYVENVAAAIALAALDDRAAGRVYNVAEPRAWTEHEWAGRVAHIIGWHGEIVVGDADQIPAHLRFPGNADQHWVTDGSRIRRELGYAEPVDGDEALRRTITWERANPPAAPMPPIDYGAEDAALAALGDSQPAVS